MDLPLDVLRSIILILRIDAIKNLGSIDKSFYFLCSERNLWLEKFKENNLVIINDKINTLSQYTDEYRKISYATYITNCLINMIEIKKFSIEYNICWFRVLINDLINILPKDHPVFVKIKDNNYNKKYINISIAVAIEDGGVIGYTTYKNPDDENNEMIVILHEKYNDKNVIISLITKILYYHPSININDINHIPIVITKKTIFDNDNFGEYGETIIDNRIKYWDECYSKYEELYF